MVRKYSFREKINNRLLKFGFYCLGKSYLERMLHDVLSKGNNIPNSIINYNVIGKYNLSVAVSIILEKGISLVIDVGANEGQFGTMMYELGYKGKLISFEPQKECFEKLVIKTENYPNWEVFNLGISEKQETSSLNIYEDNTFSSLYKSSSKGELITDNKLKIKASESIKLVRLDDFIVKNYPSVCKNEEKIFLKTDTQGHDLKVLQSSRNILEYVKAIFIELSVIPIYEGVPDICESLYFLKQLGYNPMGFFPLHNEKTLESVEMDALFIQNHD